MSTTKQDTTATWGDLIGMVGRLVRVTPCAGTITVPVSLTVADVSDQHTANGWAAFTVSLVGTAGDRLSHPGSYIIAVDQRRFPLTLAWTTRQQPHQHYLATLVQPAVG